MIIFVFIFWNGTSCSKIYTHLLTYYWLTLEIAARKMSHNICDIWYVTYDMTYDMSHNLSWVGSLHYLRVYELAVHKPSSYMGLIIYHESAIRKHRKICWSVESKRCLSILFVNIWQTNRSLSGQPYAAQNEFS